MKNCLITTLKGVVDNNTLPVFGELKLTANQISGTIIANQVRLRIRSIKATELHVDGDGYFANSYADLSDVSKRKTSIEIPANTNVDCYFKNDNYNIYIMDKYSIAAIVTFTISNYADETLFGISLDSLEFSTEIDYLSLIGSHNSGDIAKLGRMTKVNTLIFGMANTTQIVGAVEDFVAGQIANGRTTVTTSNFIKTNMTRCPGITFGGRYLKQNSQGILTWESTSKIAIYGSGDTLEQCTYVMERGYNAAEIAAWQAQGLTVIDVLTNTTYNPIN